MINKDMHFLICMQMCVNVCVHVRTPACIKINKIKSLTKIGSLICIFFFFSIPHVDIL